MKTTIITAIFLFTISGLLGKSQTFYAPLPGVDPAFDEEAYVNDIPFDTWKISKLCQPDDLMLQLPEEGYVDDIPFSTAKVAREALLGRLMGQKDEAYVDDIPFNTEKIFNEAMMSDCIARWQEEENVNDIPFSTRYHFCCQQMVKRLLPEYKDESGIRDICFNTQAIAYQHLFNSALKKYRDEEFTDDDNIGPIASWYYDPGKEILIYQAGSATYIRGIRGPYNSEFILDVEKYMEEFNEKIKGLESLSFEYPF